jgi:hypothetical protein
LCKLSDEIINIEIDIKNFLSGRNKWNPEIFENAHFYVLAVIRACSLQGEILHLLFPGVATLVGISGRFVLHTPLNPLLIEGKNNYLNPITGIHRKASHRAFCSRSMFEIFRNGAEGRVRNRRSSK